MPRNEHSRSPARRTRLDPPAVRAPAAPPFEPEPLHAPLEAPRPAHPMPLGTDEDLPTSGSRVIVIDLA